MTEYEALQEAVSVMGGQVHLAKALAERTGQPIKQGHVWNWLNRSKRLPDRYALHVERITCEAGQCVKASDLCHLAFSAA